MGRPWAPNAMTGLQVLCQSVAELGPSPRDLPTTYVFHKYVLNTYRVPGPVLGAQRTSVNETNIPALRE